MKKILITSGSDGIGLATEGRVLTLVARKNSMRRFATAQAS